jgi:hypothetical protein
MSTNDLRTNESMVLLTEADNILGKRHSYLNVNDLDNEKPGTVGSRRNYDVAIF